MTVVGARPQFIKAAVVSRALRADAIFDELLVHTGQHFDRRMSEVFFEELGLVRPTANLGIEGGAHGASTGAMLAALEQQMLERGPAAVMVFGDTNSTLAGALAAAKLHIPVVHVEAGLRSYNRRMPEELNRVLTDHLSDLLLCSSMLGVENLAEEGVGHGVHVIGDTMYDAVLHYRGQAQPSGIAGSYAVATVHRAENTDDEQALASLLAGLGRSPMPIVMPLHPRTRKALERFNLTPPDTVDMIEPVPYLEMLGLMRDSSVVLTDSGGLQKEAYYLGKPCVTLRSETEWSELVELGVNRIVGTDVSAIEAAFAWAQKVTMPDEQPYGDGRSGARVVELVADLIGSG